MGNPAARLGDMDSGHGCYSPRKNVAASDDVFINGRGAHRRGDSWRKHCCNGCHTGTTSGGSGSVFINGRNATRIADSVSCGGVIITGSSNVFIGG